MTTYHIGVGKDYSTLQDLFSEVNDLNKSITIHMEDDTTIEETINLNDAKIIGCSEKKKISKMQWIQK